jgi:hypothetical protein
MSDLISTKSVTKITSLIFINLITPKARAKHELLFNKPASDSHLSRTTQCDQILHYNDCYERIWSHLKQELSLILCSTNRPLALVANIKSGSKYLQRTKRASLSGPKHRRQRQKIVVAQRQQQHRLVPHHRNQPQPRFDNHHDQRPN